jgi:hypothetical protein
MPAGSSALGSLEKARMRWTMCVLLGFLFLTALLFGLGFALHVLWWIAIVALVFWLVGLAFRPRGGRWYYW